jgi:hypothetical protein
VQSGGLSSYRWPAPGDERVSGSSATLPQCEDDELCLEFQKNFFQIPAR